MRLVIGVDLSTTGVKAIAWDEQGNDVAEGRAELSLSTPSPGAYLQNAEDWWVGLCGATRGLMPRLSGHELLGVCITHQRETCVVTDGEGAPLHPALVWMDARCTAEVARARDTLGSAELHRLSGKPPCTTPSLYKLMFLLDRLAPQLRDRADLRVLDVHGFTVWRLTERFATSLASADPMGLCDMKARRWAPELVGLLGIGEECLPELVEPGAVVGTVTVAAARETGLPAGLPVVAGGGDGQCAGLGAGITSHGPAYLNLGTAIVCGVLSPDYRIDPAFRTLYAMSPGSYFLETDLKGGTFTLDWLTQKLCPSADKNTELAELARAAEELSPGSAGLLLVPYWNGVMNPYWDDDARGITIGWHGGHGPAHLYRAVLEGIAFETRLHLSGVEAALGEAIGELRVMGGGADSDLWCRILADVTHKSIVRSQSREATSLGAGVLAAAALGLHGSLDEAARAMTRGGKRFAPSEQAPAYDALYEDVYRDLYPSIAGKLARLSQLTRS